MHKRRRSKRIAAKKRPGEKKRKKLLSGDDVPFLCNELIERIVQYVPYQSRGTLARMSTYWSRQVWKVPVLVHGKTRFKHAVDDIHKFGSYRDCTCPECHRQGFHASQYRKDLCPCPLCVNQKELDVLYDCCNRVIDGVGHRPKQTEFRNDAKAVYEETDRSVYFRYMQLYDVYEGVTGQSFDYFPPWMHPEGKK